MAKWKWDDMPDYQDGSIFDVIEEPVYIMDIDTDELLYLNLAARKKLGYEKKSYAGVKCYAALRNRSTRCDFCGADLMDETGHYRKHLYQPRMDVQHLVKGSLLRFRGHHARMELCVDIEALLFQSEQLRQALAAESVLNHAIHSLYVNLNADEAVDEVLSTVGRQLKAKRSYMAKIDGDKLSLKHEWCAAGADSMMERVQNMDIAMIGRWLESFKKHQAVIVGDLEHIANLYPMEYDLMAAQGVTSYAVLPIVVEQELYGYIGFDNIPEQQLAAAGDMLSTLAFFIGTALMMAKNRQLLEDASYTDAMTGVANRNAFVRDIEKIEKDKSKGRQQAGVLFFDLNGLKRINDMQGHRAGDRAITALADALTLFFRKKEIYRTGGDEFVIICLGMPEKNFHERMQQTLQYLRRSSDVSVSVGHSWSVDLSKITLRQTISRADEIMYQEKQKHYEALNLTEGAPRNPKSQLHNQEYEN